MSAYVAMSPMTEEVMNGCLYYPDPYPHPEVVVVVVVAVVAHGGASVVRARQGAEDCAVVLRACDGVAVVAGR